VTMEKCRDNPSKLPIFGHCLSEGYLEGADCVTFLIKAFLQGKRVNSGLIVGYLERVN
jgi:hypothetical protein